MKFKTFEAIYFLSYQTSVWIVLAIGYANLNIFFSMFSAFLAIIGIICTAILYLKVSSLEKVDGITVNCKLGSNWYQKRDRSIGVYFLLLITISVVSISFKGMFGSLLSAIIALYVLFNTDEFDNIPFLLCGLKVFNANLNDKKIMCIGKNKNIYRLNISSNSIVSAAKLTSGVYVIRGAKS